MAVKSGELELRPKALLVSLPWTTLTEPSLGLAILRATLDDAGIYCRVEHANIYVLQFLRPQTYYAIANTFALNDFLFSGVLNPGLTNQQFRWLREKTQHLLSFGVIDQCSQQGLDGII